MSGPWTENGPISLPTRPLAYGAGLVVIGFAVLGVSLGFQASFRRVAGPEAGAERGTGPDDAIAARPIVDLSPTTTAPVADRRSADEPDSGDADEETQPSANPADQAGPPSAAPEASADKPSPPVKPADEATPAPPVKSDVPF
jgi:hypothetical protein